jgi:hypothetical protein
VAISASGPATFSARRPDRLSAEMAAAMVRRAWKRTLGAVSVATAVIAAAALPTASATGRFDTSDPAQAAEYQRALSLGVRAYVYGYPLLDTDRVFRTATSANVPNGSGGGPVNEFSHVRGFTNPSDKAVVAPNRDTLYSMAWLELSRHPVVLHMPVVKRRFVVFELLDPYTNAFAQVGSVGLPPGDYAVVPPHWHGRLPRGVRTIRSPQTRVWIIGRTYVRGAADIPNAVKIQDEYAITPLSSYGQRYTPPRPRHVVLTTKRFTVPGTGRGANPLAFFDALGDALARFPPPMADGPLLTRLHSVGIGAGLHPSTSPRLDAATKQGLHDAIAAGTRQVTADIQVAFLSGASHHNGWLVSRTGTYGTDYTTRAVVDAIGLGAPQSSLAIYPFTVTDRNLHPLSGANRYVAHFSAQDLPFPVRVFWSLTLYDASGFFVPNRAGIYLVNDRSPLHYNSDGSLDVYIQPSAPGDPPARRNWLPSPDGKPFRLIMRLYEPTNVAGILSGRTWQPPTVLPCRPAGSTSAGVRCPS